MLRVGGGFATISDHLQTVSQAENIKIYKSMKNENKTYGEVVSNWLKIRKAPNKVINKYLSNQNLEERGEFFMEAMLAYDK